MNFIKIAICDDEKNIRAYLASLVRKQGRECEIAEYVSADEYLLDQTEHDLLFLDIEPAGDGSTEQTQQAIVESISGTITRIDENKTYDLNEEEIKIIADIIENGTWNTEGTAECANDCKLIIDERTYYYHSECGTFNDKENNQNLPVTAKEKESINVILAHYIILGSE